MDVCGKTVNCLKFRGLMPYCDVIRVDVACRPVHGKSTLRANGVDLAG